MAEEQDEKVIPKIADAAEAIGSSTMEPARQTPEVAAPVPTADPLPAAPSVTPAAGERDYAPVPLGDGQAGREQKRERRRVAERLLDLPGIPVRERAVDERSVGSAAVTGFAAGFSRGLAAGAGGSPAATEPAIQEARAHEAHVAGVAAGEDDALQHLTEAEQADVAERILRGRSPVMGDVHAASLSGRASTSALSANEQEILAELRRPGADRSTQDQVLAELPDRVVHEASLQIAHRDDQAHQVQDAVEDAQTRQDEFFARHPELASDGQQQLSSEVLQRHPELRPDPVGPEPHDPDYVRQAGAR